MDAHSLQNKPGTTYYLVLLVVIALYAPYFLSFTVFDGFTTFSNDAANYVLVARKWSPYFTPTDAETFATPFHDYPPAFAGLLALTAASESLWASHLFVSICMLASLLVIGVFIRRHAPPTISVLTVLVMCLMPGIIINSLGILSENLYLLVSLAALAVYAGIRNRDEVNWGWNAGLLALLVLAVFTRSVGVTLIAAFIVVPTLDRALGSRQRLIVPALALTSLLVWLVWELLLPDLGSYSYASISEQTYLGEPDLLKKLAGAWHTALNNVVEMLTQWNLYFFQSNYNIWLFVFSYAVLAICAITFGLRVARLEMDAIYLLFYLGLVLVWPFIVEVKRFLHPIAILFFAQPVLYWGEQGAFRSGRVVTRLAAGALFVIAGHLAIIQWDLFSKQRTAMSDFPRVAHSLDYYDQRYGKHSEVQAHLYQLVSRFMAKSAELVPRDHIVAVLKHENYAILADRRAVVLSTAVPYPQQLCNLTLDKADFVFITPLTGPANWDGLELVEKYESISRVTWPMRIEGGRGEAYLIELDKSAIKTQLEEGGFNCSEVQYFTPADSSNL